MTTNDLVIPRLRPEYLGAPFPGTELPELSVALDQVQQWIDSGERPDESTSGASGWVAWPDQPDFQPIYGPVSLNTGAAGIAWYSLAAAAATGDPAHLERAQRAGRFVAAHWREHLEGGPFAVPNISLAYYGGVAGIAAVFLELADRLPEFAAERDALLDLLVERATAPRGFGWTGNNAMLGDAGIAATLLRAAEKLDRPALLEAATRVGDGILAEERADGSWPGVPYSLFGIPGDAELEGFELGTVGIAFLFARLAELGHEPRFREGAARAAAHIAAQAETVGDAAFLRRGGGDISFGYCTGSSGIIRSFLQVYRATNDPEHLEWALRFGRGILRSGVPARQTPGNQWVFHQCCGSAAVLESLLGLWLETGDSLWLEAARAQGDDLLIRSVADAAGRRWYSESHVLPTGTLKAEVGHQVGAAGIALALLRLQLAECDGVGETFTTIRLPDDPYRAVGG